MRRTPSLVLALLGLAACSRREAAPPVVHSEPPAEVAAFAGSAGDAAAILCPIVDDGDDPDWSAQRLRAAFGAGEHATFASLRIFHLGGSDAAPLALGSLALEVALPDGVVRALEPARPVEELPAVLRLKTPAAYRDGALPGARALEVWVALPAENAIERAASATLRLADKELTMRPLKLSRESLERLETPDRELVTACARGTAAGGTR